MRSSSCSLYAILLLMCVVAGCSRPAPPVVPDAPPAAPSISFFRDITAGSGVDFTYKNGQEAGHRAILESLGGGVGLLDLDGDGLLDILCTGGGHYGGLDGKTILGHPCRLYKNLGNRRFRDVSDEVGLGAVSFYTHGVVVFDYDRDGFPDVLLTGWGRVALLHNEPAAGSSSARRLVDVTQRAGLGKDIVWTTSGAAADFDGDGYPDLYLCQYVDWSFANHPQDCSYHDPKLKDVCPPKRFKALPHKLFRSKGDGTFEDVSEAAGLYQKQAREKSKGLGVVAVDVNDDGKPDVYVANDTMDNLLFMNRSDLKKRGNVLFEEMGLERGVARDDQAAPNGSMGVAAGDYDGRGRPSLFVTNYEQELHALYRNDGGENFSYQTQRAGIAALGPRFVGFGTAFVDVDLDGWEDLILVNGHVIRHPQKIGIQQQPILLLNRERGADRRFENRSQDGGDYFRGVHVGRGLAVGDLDNDGRVDLVVSHLNEPVAILFNEAGAGRHWLGVDLRADDHRALVGSKLVLKVQERTLTKFMTGGGSYLSASDARHSFGLGSADRIEELILVGPTDRVTGKRPTHTWKGLEVDRYHVLTLPKGFLQINRVF